MLTSLLSVYIASALAPDLNSQGFSLPITQEGQNPIIRTASFDLNSLLEAKSIPVKQPQFISPIINASSSIAVDLNTGTVLYEKNPHKRLAIASITKLMTILIILDENELSETTTISNNASTTEGSTMFLRTGEQITIENLLYGTLIASANDAAIALAEHNAGSEKAFIEKMNTKAKSLGLLNTNFSNPSGLDSSTNYSSAYDVAKLAQAIYQKDFIKKAATIKNLDVSSTDGKYVHKLETTNELLNSYLHINGLKTGRTDLAGECLVAVAENEDGKEIVSVVLNSTSRFTESKILVDWVFRAYKW